MRVGVSLFTCDRGITPAQAAMAAEERGFDTLYVPEHTHIPVNRDTPHPATGDETLPDDRYMRTLDPWVSLATAASVTTTLGLGTSVALPLEHDPIALAKTIASLDHLSGGRVRFGVGFGWNLEELADHGIPPKRRRTALRDYLRAMQELWSNDIASYEGEFVRFGPSWAWPKPIQRPRVPIYVGAFGNDRLFDWVVENADGWITTPLDEGVDAAIASLREKWHRAGREGEPEVVVLDTTPGDRIEECAGIGATELVVALPDAGRDEVLRFLDDLAAKVERSSVATR